jgi:hypothetical protein
MDRITRCPRCGKRVVPVVTISGRTDLQCIRCDDPAVKWAESSLTAPEKAIVAEPGAMAPGGAGMKEAANGRDPERVIRTPG